ncbi:MAG: hypothetical protein NWF03_05750, partial [Candidatus Bathyarchaeota archaeon]|nr:hypothetical protein [Candidatus Bathyarchaeota archaeon]
MPNRSKTKKLRLIFIFDLIIISLAAAGYLYIQPSIAGEATLAAEFQVSDLFVSPSEVRANLPVIISVNVTNTGNDSGDVVIELLLNDALEQSQLAQLFAGESKIVEFSVTKTTLGTYTVKIADLVGSFKVIEAAPVIEDPGTGELPSGPEDGRPANIVASNLVISPSEVWAGQSVTISGLFTNHGDKTGYSTVSLRINGESVGSENVALLGGTNTRVQFTITAGGVGDYQVKLGALTGSLKVVPNGKHTLIIGAKGAKAEFTLDGKPYVATVSVLVDVGSHTIAMPPTDPTGEYRFLNWEDDRYNTNPTRTVNVQSAIRYEAVYEGGASCPSLYYWNGSEYVYVAEVSNGGWLGYIGYIDANGEITFLGSNPWDHAKISDQDLELTTIDGKDYYDMTLSQRWSEIFYLDRAYMIVADHSADVDVHATMVHYLNPSFTDQIYTVSKELATPVSAVNEKGDDVLADIAELDGDFTPGFNGVESPAWDDLYWNVLTLDLGDLSDAERIKLVINGMVDWGPAAPYYEWIDLFKQAAEDGLIADGTPVTPPPYLEIKDANG